MTVSSPIFTLTADGISAPTYDEILEYFKEKARGIFGTDINLDEDTQDGQLLAIFASAINDLNAQAMAVFNAYNPTTAVGLALDSAVKVNGLSRHVATHSQADLTLIGQAGTVITNGYALDTSGNKWVLPETVSIPLSGEVTVTATAEDEGDIDAAAGAISKIGTPTLGWQSVTNATAAIAGDAVESDAELRERQSESTMQASVGIWDALVGAVGKLDGVQDVAGRHNDTGETSDEGIPPHSIALVIAGGSVDDIVPTIWLKKSMGVTTYGSISTNYIDSLGNEYTINFSRPVDVPIKVAITLQARASWLQSNIEDVQTRLAEYINGLAIAEQVDIMKCISEIVREASQYDADFYLKAVTLNGTADSVKIAWNEKASTTADDIEITVVD